MQPHHSSPAISESRNPSASLSLQHEELLTQAEKPLSTQSEAALANDDQFYGTRGKLHNAQEDIIWEEDLTESRNSLS